jgi:hypothetical protein
VPRVSFHALRHSNFSALIASGIDPLTVSRRIGHASVSTTLNIYAHRFAKTDAGAADGIEAALKRQGVMRMAPRPRRRRYEGRPIEGLPNAKTFRIKKRYLQFHSALAVLIIILTTGFYLASLKKLR